MKKRKTLKTLIIVMLILVVAAVAWILHLGKAANTAREPEQAQNEQASQETAQEEEQKKEEEQSAMKKSTEEKLAASHVYSYRGTEGPEEHSFKAYDAAIDAGSQYIGVDVVISSDGVLYVSSELNAYTMTDYNGMYEYISSETVDGLKTAAGNKILRLSEVFEHYGKDINYVIEIKDNSDKCLLAFEKLVARGDPRVDRKEVSGHAEAAGMLEPGRLRLCIGSVVHRYHFRKSYCRNRYFNGKQL